MTTDVASKEHLNPRQFKYSYHEDINEHEIMAHDNSGQLGRLLWNADDGEISHVYVGDKLRRRGIATDMWNEAHSEALYRGIIDPEHSSRRSQEGDAWAKSIGGDIPELTDDVDGWTGQT